MASTLQAWKHLVLMSARNSFELHYKFPFCWSHFNQFSICCRNRVQSWEQLSRLTKMVPPPPSPLLEGLRNTGNPKCRLQKERGTKAWGPVRGRCVACRGSWEELWRKNLSISFVSQVKSCMLFLSSQSSLTSLSINEHLVSVKKNSFLSNQSCENMSQVWVIET